MPRKQKRNASYNNISSDAIICRIEKSIVTDDKSDQSFDNAPALVEQDFLLEKKLYYQMKVESFRWTVYYFFIKRHGMSPPEDVDLYTHWTGRGEIGSKVKRDLKLPRTISVKNRLLSISKKAMECI